MLTGDSYAFALICYGLAAIVALVLIYRHWLNRLPSMWRRLLIGVLAAGLLTPVSPGPDADTLAPALIVALFNAAFLDGWESARHAILALAATSVLGMAAALLSLLIPAGADAETSNNQSSGVQPENSTTQESRE